MSQKQSSNTHSQSFQLTPQEYQNIMVNAPIGISFSTPEGRFLDVNTATARMFGYESPRELIDSTEDIGQQLYADPEDRKEIRRFLEKHDEGLNIECRFVRKDGSLFWALNNARAVRDKKGEIIYYQSFFSDITDSKLVKEALREKEETLQAFFDAVHESMVLIDTKGTVILSNMTGAQRLGKTVREFIATCLYDHFPPEVASVRKEQYDRVVATGKPISFNETRSGKIFEQRCYPVFDEEEKVSGVAIFAHEITERKQAEEALEERDIQFRKLSSHVPGIIYQFLRKPDGTYCIPFSTDTIKDAFDCSPQDVREDFSPITRVIFPEDLNKFLDSIKYSAEHMTTWKCEYRVHIPGRPVRWMLGQSTPEKLTDGSIIWHGFNTDITGRKQMEEALKTSEENFHRSLDDSPLGIRIVSQEGKTLYANRAFLDIFEYNGIDEEKTSQIKDRYTAKSLREHILRKEQRRQGKDTLGEYEIEIVARDKIIRHLLVQRKRVLWNGTRHYQVIYLDITKRRRAELERKDALEKLRISERELQSILDNSPLLISEFNRDGRYERVNSATCNLYGKAESEIVGKSFHELLPPDTTDIFMERISKIYESRSSMTVEDIINVDGNQRSFSTVLFPIFDSRGGLRSVGSISQEITELKKAERERSNLEERLNQMEKMTSLSRISAGVAHEILNPLSIISISLQFLKSMENLPSKVQEELDGCMKQIDRIVAISDNLKQLSRSTRNEMVPDDINDIIAQVLRMYDMQLRIEGVVTDVRYDSSLPALPLDRNKIEQVLINLLSNALAAMEGIKDKFLIIETKKISVDADEYVRIVVSDTGTGIKKKNLQRIFEPFYTNRGQGVGTGMGLSISHGIINQHGGRIWAENNEWGGSSFFIELPLNSVTETTK